MCISLVCYIGKIIICSQRSLEINGHGVSYWVDHIKKINLKVNGDIKRVRKEREEDEEKST